LTNLYLKVEIRSRELESRLLLALIAAERGHDVLVGDLRTLLSHRFWLAPGILHDNSLTPAPRKIRFHAALVAAGFRVTSQDEEHGLLQPSHDEFVAQRFGDRSLANAAAAFAWSTRDRDALLAAHPDHRDRIVVTGSPRVDLWRPELSGYHRALPAPGADPQRPILLFASNSGATNQNRFWVNLREQRPGYFRGDDDVREFSQYDDHADEFRYLGQLVRAIRQAARAFPDAQLVVRPHPTEHDGAWEDLLGPMPDNVLISRRGELGRWVHRAAVLVHNGSTSAIEATTAGVPTVAFVPDGWRGDLLSNQLGRRAGDADELLTAVSSALALDRGADRLSGWAEIDVATTLHDRLAALEGPFAAERIVDTWDTLAVPGGRNRPRVARWLATTHRRVGEVRALVRGDAQHRTRFDTSHKFPPLSTQDVAEIVTAYRTTLGRFEGVRVSLVGPRLVHVRPRR
jgi:surface carbohydrate biosynthesis protein